MKATGAILLAGGPCYHKYTSSCNEFTNRHSDNCYKILQFFTATILKAKIPINLSGYARAIR